MYGGPWHRALKAKSSSVFPDLRLQTALSCSKIPKARRDILGRLPQDWKVSLKERGFGGSRSVSTDVDGGHGPVFPAQDGYGQ
jgi:hypothetical protein